MPATRDAILHIPAEGGVEAELLRDLLGSVNAAYSGYLAFERLVSDGPSARLSRRYLWRDWPFLGPDWPNDTDNFLVSPSERLIVARVELASPGFWEFLGLLNPLEVTRKYLEDRHRRRQDREYREAVSYTHLDVYKRQVEEQAPVFSRGGRS